MLLFCFTYSLYQLLTSCCEYACGNLSRLQYNTWSQKADFPGTARQLATGFSIGTKGYIGTGLGAFGVKAKDFWEYDPSTDTWTQKANFGGTARLGCAGFSIGSKGYIGTGDDGAQTKDFWEYDPSTDVWTRKADFGGEARGTDVGFSIGSKGYIGTGYHNGIYLSDFWEWDQASDTWIQIASYPQGPTSSATGLSGFALGNKGYVGGGGSSSNFHKSFWEYSPDNNSACTASSRIGNFEKEPVVASELTSTIKIYPNPSNGEMAIQYFFPIPTKAEFSIYDLAGRKMYGHPLSGETNQLNIVAQDLHDGIYFYKVIANDNMIAQGKIIIIR